MTGPYRGVLPSLYGCSCSLATLLFRAQLWAAALAAGTMTVPLLSLAPAQQLSQRTPARVFQGRCQQVLHALRLSQE